jgi:uncharacterized protein (TIGR01777 family)
MKIVIPGGSGQIGTVLARALSAVGHEVIVLSRKPAFAAWRTVAWDGASLGSWTGELDGADAVINLTGRSVDCRYNAENRRQILESRVNSTRAVGEAISRCSRPPRVWLQMATATIYSHRFDAANDEVTGIIGGNEIDAPETWRFSIKVAAEWERAANESITLRTRKVILRSAMVMSPDQGGVFDTLLGLVRHGLGGRAGDGRQFMSWIHETDFVNAIHWLISHGEMSGPVIVASPNPIPNQQFMRELRSAWGVRFGLPSPKWMLEIGARFLGTETELILKSRRVVPTRLLESGFEFRYPNWSEAADELCERWR